MRFTTIWTLRGLPLRERLNQILEWVTIKVAAHLPKKVKYWSFILVGGKEIRTDEVVPEVTYMDLLQRAGERLSP